MDKQQSKSTVRWLLEKAGRMDKGEERVAGRMAWVARGEYVRLLLKASSAIGSCSLSRREAEGERSS